jgi:PncC family amidohydrolase
MANSKWRTGNPKSQIQNPKSQIVGRLLLERGLTLAVAESCTGGLVGSLITDVAGSSSYFLGGVIAYAYAAKEQVLDVQHATLMAQGAVSPAVAAEMAQGARRLFAADIAVAVTGIAGPGGGSAEKPVGLVYIHLSAADAELAECHVWDADRIGNKQRSAEAALALVARYLSGQGNKEATMPLPEFIDEPILVQARFLPDGQVQPLVFVWRNRTRYITDLGRQWQEAVGDVIWRCYLARTPTTETFELRFNSGSGQWMLARAWLPPSAG